MTQEVYIDHLSFPLGSEVRTVEETAAKGRTRSGAALLREAGFGRHCVSAPGTTAYDLACRAVQPLRGNLGSIGAIVYSTCIPINANVGDEARFTETRDVKHLMDFPASHLQRDFGLENAIVFGLDQQACTGMLGSLRLARMLLVSEPEISRVLCVTADRFPDGALYEQAYNLISDGAAACIVSNRPEGFRIVACHGVTNGAMVMASDEVTLGSYFNYTHRVINETLAKAGIGIDAINWIVPQNTNTKAWQILSRLLKFDFERVYSPTIGEVAHVISADNIINLKSLVDTKRVMVGERVLMFMAGYGMNWQCVILEKV